jgi:hypothetical protein
MQDDLTIPLFFWTCAFMAGVEAMKAEGWRVRAFGALAVFLVALGVFWQWVKEFYPPLTGAITEVATSPHSWFTLIALGLVVVAVTGRSRRMTSHAPQQEVVLPPELSEVPARLDALSAKMDTFAKSAEGRQIA